jgi:hypothetical protein
MDMNLAEIVRDVRTVGPSCLLLKRNKYLIRFTIAYISKLFVVLSGRNIDSSFSS